MVTCQEFMHMLKPARKFAGERYLARGGTHTVYEGDLETKAHRHSVVP
jgi:uncharacterized protein (DUF1330 family)